MKGVLLAVDHNREAAVHDAEVGVERGAHSDIEGAVVLVTVEPIAVIHVAVARCGMHERLRRLMNGVVIEFRKHGFSDSL